MKAKKIPALGALALFIGLLGLSACNTIQGAGQDLKAGGEALEKKAERNKSY